jgi:glutathione S-transferase
MTIKIYDSPQSPNARKVRLFAAELGIPLERHPVDFSTGQRHAPAYRAMNPNGMVPTIDDDGFVLWESAAILRYLAQKKPERGFVPSDPKVAARLEQWMFWFAAHVEPWLLSLVLERLVKPFLGQRGNDPTVIEVAEGNLERFLGVLEAQLEGRTHVLGAESIADFQIAPWLEAGTRVAVDVSRYANITRWLGRMQAKPYWTEA